MKALLMIFMLFMCALAFADPVTCGQYVSQRPEMRKALEFLKRYEGEYRLGKCKIEMYICDSIASDDKNYGEQVGDLLVTNDRGEEIYVPLYFFQKASDRYYSKIQNGRIMFHYEYEDFMPNPRTLNRESIHLEILSRWTGPELSRLELGYYLKKNYIERRQRYKYQWTICEEGE